MKGNISLLIYNIERGDEKSFEELYMLYYDKLFTFARIYVPTSQQAEDVVSDLFLNIWNNRHTLSSITYFETYLYRSVKYGCLNALNSGYNRLVSLGTEKVDFDIFIDAETPEQVAIYNQLNEALRRAIDNLPERCKLIYKMVKEDNLKHKEIAEILDISPKTVEVQVAIATKKLEQELSPFLYSMI